MDANTTKILENVFRKFSPCSASYIGEQMDKFKNEIADSSDNTKSSNNTVDKDKARSFFLSHDTSIDAIIEENPVAKFIRDYQN